MKLEILSIPNNKSHGRCSCPTQLLKCYCDIVSPVLANFLKKSISLGAYPSKLKMSKILPLYKANDELQTSFTIVKLKHNFEKRMYNSEARQV